MLTLFAVASLFKLLVLAPGLYHSTDFEVSGFGALKGAPELLLGAGTTTTTSIVGRTMAWRTAAEEHRK